MHALIIDDSPPIRVMLRRILRDLGFQTVEAANGKEALGRVYEAARFDVILVDWNMPEMSGIEFVRRLREDPEQQQVPVMMITSEVEAAQIGEALAAGVDEYISKPFTKATIFSKLQLLNVLP